MTPQGFIELTIIHCNLFYSGTKEMSAVNAALWIGGLKKRILDRDAIQESDSGVLNMI